MGLPVTAAAATAGRGGPAVLEELRFPVGQGLQSPVHYRGQGTLWGQTNCVGICVWADGPRSKKLRMGLSEQPSWVRWSEPLSNAPGSLLLASFPLIEFLLVLTYI